MIINTLLQASRKQVQPKSEPVKIKHKTYRQLLGLDRPKKQIYVESDNENDDFLEKLLKEQQKEKKKNSLRKSHSSSRKSRRTPKVSQSSQNAQIKKEKPEQAPKNEPNKAKSSQKQHIRKVVHTSNVNEESPGTNSRMEQIKQRGQSEAIKIDDSNQAGYAVGNSLQVVLRMGKSSHGFKALRKRVEASQPCLRISHNLNPEDHTITHKFSQTTGQCKFKSSPLSTQKLLAMSEMRVSGQPQRRVFRRESLFKNQQQEDNFLLSLKLIKPKNSSVPSLL